MTPEELASFVEAGAPLVIDQYRRELGQPDRFDLEARAWMRRVERSMIVAIDRARTLGYIAARGYTGSNNAGQPPTLAEYGIDWRELRGFSKPFSTKRMTDEEFEAALTQAIAEKLPSRERIAEIVQEMREGPRDQKRNQMLAGSRHHQPERIINHTIDTLSGLTAGVELLGPDDFDSLHPDLVRSWSRELTECRRILTHLNKELASRG